ncbi:YhgE/Pip family protein [Leucobacter sp. W1038]|uniref:YhgE/Pip domain-containing protein n=1 Tax=Leucobacter sp. W1038 TaxID=3438281 RepID=UPI003D95DC1D
MSLSLTRLRSTKRVSWRTIVGLILVPLTAAGLLLWGLWNPTDRLDTITAAVVNLDEPVELDGQLVPMGRVLAGELIGGDSETNFTWVLTDEEDAAAGLDDGRYGTVVTIPENFSSAATSLSRGVDEAETATIDITTSDRGRLLDSALSGIVTSTATAVLNEQLGAQFVGNIFVGFTELGTGIGEAADGAAQLADGGSQLADGVAELASGAAELSSGASQLASGGGALVSGANELASGSAALSGGAGQLATGARAAATGGAELATGVEGYVGAINGIIDPTLSGGAELITQLDQLVADIESGEIPIPEAELKKEVLAGIAELRAQLAGIGDQLGLLRGSGSALAVGIRASADGQAQLASGVEGLAGGLSQYSAGVAQYASGISQYVGGVGALAAGTPALADGAAQLADGARLSADGTAELADGLYTAANEIPAYTDAEREKLAETAVKPVTAVGGSDELFNAAGVPLFAGIALWAGALATFLVLSPLWRRTHDAARGIGAITLRSALPAAGIGAAQGGIAGVLLPIMLGYDLAQGLGFFALALVAGISFALVNQGLSALLGGFGRFISFALLVVGFAIGVISTAPPLLQSIGDASPLGALFSGFQAIAGGVGGTGSAIWALAVWAGGGLVLTAFAVARARKRTAE